MKWYSFLKIPAFDDPRDQLRAKILLIVLLAYSVSHDLRAPLRHITGFSRIMIEEDTISMEPEAVDRVKRIHNSAIQMDHLINKLLEFSRLNRKAIVKVPVDLVSLIHHVLHELSEEVDEQRVKVKIDSLPICQGDRFLLHQVITNLLSNALKFSRHQTPAHIEFGCHGIKGENVYFIRDNGVGFDKQYADKLFGVFQRLHHHREFEGTGIGLATVRRIIHRHGGRVWAESQQGYGATFYFTLPD